MDRFQHKYRISSARLKYWDYGSNASYFVTICTAYRACFFGDIIDGEMIFSEIGKIAGKCWSEIPEHFPFVKLDVFVVMLNHVHGILIIDKPDGGQPPQPPEQPSQPAKNKFGPQSQNLASVIRGYKTGVTKYARNNNIEFAWQSRYHDHIIRDERSYRRIRNYIINNPQKWNNDKFNREKI